MNWYIVKLVYQIVNENVPSPAQFDEQLRLMRADDWEWAVEKAHTLGRLGESIFFNKKRQNIRWKFAGVADIVPVIGLEDGTQLYSETKEPDDANAYLDVINRRSERLRDSVNSFHADKTFLDATRHDLIFN